MEVDGVLDADFAQRTENFMQWFRSLPGATFHDHIQIQDLRSQGAGRGVVAAADIEPDTVLFTIPREAILCTATSPLPAQIPSLFQDDDNNLDEDPETSSTQDPWTRLILILLHEHFRSAASPWAPYLSVLPTAFNTPMFWPDSDLAALQASPIVQKIGKASADAMIRSKILPVFREHQSIFVPLGTAPPSDDDLLHLAHTMGSAIMAYAFDLNPDDDPSDDEAGEDGWAEDTAPPPALGMVPMADMLNADAVFNAHINHAPDYLTATSLRKIHAGEEILNYYGPLPNGELLRRYGYVTPAHAQYDVVEIPWEMVMPHIKAQVPWLGEKGWEGAVAKLQDGDEDYEVEDSFVLERRTDEPDGTGGAVGEAVFEGLPEELTEQVGLLLKAIRKIAPKEGEALSDKVARKEICLESVLRALGDVEARYETSLEEDEQALSSEERPTGRLEMAAWVRRGEKRLLREASAWVVKELDGLRREKAKATRDGTRDREGGPSAKRRRV